MTKWTVYTVSIPYKPIAVYMTDTDVEALATFLGDAKIEIIISSTKKHYVTRVYLKELKEASIPPGKRKESYRKRRRNMSEIGKVYGPQNGKKVGDFARDSGHLARLRETKVICPDDHVTNLVFYKYYCKNRGLDIKKCKILQ